MPFSGAPHSNTKQSAFWGDSLRVKLYKFIGVFRINSMFSNIRAYRWTITQNLKYSLTVGPELDLAPRLTAEAAHSA